MLKKNNTIMLEQHITPETFALGKAFIALLTLGPSVNPHEEERVIEIEDPVFDRRLRSWKTRSFSKRKKSA